MLEEPRCWTRKCRHYIGVIQPDGTEKTETNACAAFPDGIPHEIAFGDNPHETVFPGQKNNIVYEKKVGKRNLRLTDNVESMPNAALNERKLMHAISLIYGEQVIEDLEFLKKYYDVIDRYSHGIMTMQMAPIKTLEAVAMNPASVPGWTHSLAMHPEDCEVLKEFFARLIRYYIKIGKMKQKNT